VDNLIVPKPESAAHPIEFAFSLVATAAAINFGNQISSHPPNIKA
jgi:hypothetical protein